MAISIVLAAMGSTAHTIAHIVGKYQSAYTNNKKGLLLSSAVDAPKNSLIFEKIECLDRPSLRRSGYEANQKTTDSLPRLELSLDQNPSFDFKRILNRRIFLIPYQNARIDFLKLLHHLLDSKTIRCLKKSWMFLKSRLINKFSKITMALLSSTKQNIKVFHPRDPLLTIFSFYHFQ